MAIILPRSVFRHCPKTGGTWVTLALRKAGIVCESRGRKHWPGVSQPPPPGVDSKPHFTFVRHPLAWYRSYWQHRMRCGWDRWDDFDQIVKSPTFAQFVERAVEFYPGYLSVIYYRRFAGPPGHEIEFVGRTENLVDDLIAGLESLGETFDAAAIRSTPPQNVAPISGMHRNLCVQISQPLIDRILESERESLARFYLGFDHARLAE